MKYELKLKEPKNNPNAELKSYLIEGNYHPFWKNWMVSLVHLREIPGLPPANKIFNSATHEILIIAYPECTKRIESEIEIEFDGKSITSLDLVKQIEVESDELAIKIFDKFVNLMISPDSDYSRANENLIKSIIKGLKIQDNDQLYQGFKNK